ncbi:MAG: hypothetical protein DRP78_04565, partial [Candidatus Omnitrophota bacterium]
MFISFLYPYNILGGEARFFWVFYKQLRHFSPQEIIFVGNKDYFKDPCHYWQRCSGKDAKIQKKWEFSFVSSQDVYSAKKYIVDQKIFKTLDKKFPDLCTAWNFLMCRRYVPLEKELMLIFSRMRNDYDIEAVLTWCNCRSLNYIAEKMGFRVIHNELGALRGPCYTQTAYFDFCGVNGNT